MKFPALLLCGSLAVAGHGPLRAADPDSTQTDAYQNSVEQEGLRARTLQARKKLMAVLDAFAAYPGVAPEIAQIRSVVQNLDTLSDKDMVEVAKALREASQTSDAGQARDRLLAVSRDQKTIQSALRKLADELNLQRDEAALHRRLMDLLLRQMAHQHQTGRLADGSVPSWELERAMKLAVAEQAGICEEIRQVFAALTRLAQTPQAPGQPAFDVALKAGENTRVNAQADAALDALTAKKLPDAIAGQSAAIDGLEAVLLALDSTLPLSERIQSMVSRMNELAAREDRLVETTRKIYFMGQNEIRDRQERLGDEAAAVSLEIAQLNAPAGSELDKARQTIRAIAESFKTKNFMEKEDKRLEITTSQKSAGASFTQTALLLQKQADALAFSDGQSPPQGTQNSQLTNIQDAADLIIKAREELQTASRLAASGTSPDAAKSLVNQARTELAQAATKVSAPDSGVESEAARKLARADGLIAEAEPKIGTSADQMRNSWTIGAADEDAGLALAEVQKAANRLAAQDSASGTSGQNSFAKDTPSAGGRPAKPKNEDANYSALARFSAKDREALSALAREPSSPEYNSMVEQYRKNLAGGEMPAQ